MNAATRAPDDRIQSARQWYPSFLANGVDYNDIEATLGRIEQWEDWCREWSQTAARYETLAEAAARDGRGLSRGEFFYRAAMCYHFAQFVLYDHPELKATAHARKVTCYASAAPFLAPPARRIEFPFAETRLPGYLRLPAGRARAPCVILIPGLHSTKEVMHILSDALLARGLATFSYDGPGQGESWERLKLRPDPEHAGSAVIDALTRRAEVDAERIAVLGHSFGGYVAPRLAAVDPRVRACLVASALWDLSDWQALQPILRRGFQYVFGVESDAQARQLAQDFSLAAFAPQVRCPTLVVHGGQDRLVAASHARRLYGALQGPKELWLFEHGNHSCYNVPELRPLMADWLAKQLGGARE
ncbi:MAG: alpha/beta fold hydrolase [Ardenticatenaceae bacterium]|nr:alpha/beta fold hydrolase [Ardenticatenaceae bacterium]